MKINYIKVYNILAIPKTLTYLISTLKKIFIGFLFNIYTSSQFFIRSIYLSKYNSNFNRVYYFNKFLKI